MQVDKAGFLALTAALAGGGVVGYLVADRDAPKATVEAPPVVTTPSPPTEEEVKRAEAEKAEEARRAELAQCDDTVGTPEECPAAGLPDSTSEGICGEGGSWAARRCADFKAHFKPKVAEAAVACLRSLKGIEQCDKERVDLCGHQALMTACQEEMPTGFLGATSTSPASLDDGSPPLSELAKQCDEVVKTCGASAPASYAECMHTLAGMNEAGRTAAASCMKLHCGDKGFIGCEAAPTTLTAAAPAIQ